MHNSDRVMVFNQKLLSELRSLQNPPRAVKTVATATLLLLGHPEDNQVRGRRSSEGARAGELEIELKKGEKGDRGKDKQR